jgi:hypothetical protein
MLSELIPEIVGGVVLLLSGGVGAVKLQAYRKARAAKRAALRRGLVEASGDAAAGSTLRRRCPPPGRPKSRPSAWDQATSRR